MAGLTKGNLGRVRDDEVNIGGSRVFTTFEKAIGEGNTTRRSYDQIGLPDNAEDQNTPNSNVTLSAIEAEGGMQLSRAGLGYDPDVDLPGLGVDSDHGEDLPVVFNHRNPNGDGYQYFKSFGCVTLGLVPKNLGGANDPDKPEFSGNGDGPLQVHGCYAAFEKVALSGSGSGTSTQYLGTVTNPRQGILLNGETVYSFLALVGSGSGSAQHVWAKLERGATMLSGSGSGSNNFVVPAEDANTLDFTPTWALVGQAVDSAAHAESWFDHTPGGAWLAVLHDDIWTDISGR